MASKPSIFPVLQRAAPRLTSERFVCSGPRQHVRSALQFHLPRKAVSKQPSPRSFHSSICRLWMGSEGVVDGPSQLSSLSRKIHKMQGMMEPQMEVKKPKEYFPKVSNKAVAYWLLGSAASVFGIVVFGGLTRLTESGYGFFTLLM